MVYCVSDRITLYAHFVDGRETERVLTILGKRWRDYNILKCTGTEASIPVTVAEAANVELETRGCGHCGANVLRPSAATQSLCESCGHMLSDRVVACSNCSAPIGLPSKMSGTELKCGFCNTEFSLG